ncbi:MAG: glycoside hydrolase family 108 protein [Chthoniobacteraceae bacterium]
MSDSYSKRFSAFMPFIFKWEGGYDNDPDDPGGETKYGIDKRSHPNVDIRALTREGAMEIYWRSYWVRYGCEWLAEPVGEVFFNACVNCGATRAQALLEAAPIPHTPGGFLDAQEAFYRRLADARPSLRKYLKGWLNRTGDLRRWASR